MNDEQKAALTATEEKNLRDWLDHVARLTIPPVSVTVERRILALVLTALADARLELQEAKDSRDGFACDMDAAQAEVVRLRPLAIGQVFPCSRCGQEWLWPGVLSTGMATCPPCLRAEVARLGQEWDDSQAHVEALENEVTRLTEERERCGKENCMGWQLDQNVNWVTEGRLNQALAERDRQREDIRRLVEALEAGRESITNEAMDTLNLAGWCEGVDFFLAEMKERYGDA